MRVKVDGKLLEELHALKREESEHLANGLYFWVEDKQRSDEEYIKAERVREKLEGKVKEITEQSGEFIGLTARSLIDAIGRLSISKFFKCLEICTGAEVEA